jgi:hypothetical protein
MEAADCVGLVEEEGLVSSLLQVARVSGSAFDREFALESVLELDQPSHHHQLRKVLFATEGTEHAGEVAG